MKGIFKLRLDLDDEKIISTKANKFEDVDNIFSELKKKFKGDK